MFEGGGVSPPVPSDLVAWAPAGDEFAAEPIGTRPTRLYDQAIGEGRFAGDMAQGLELPCTLFGDRRMCGIGAPLKHIADMDGGLVERGPFQ